MPTLAITPDNTPLKPETEVEDIKSNLDDQQEEQAALLQAAIRETMIRQRRARGAEQSLEERAETQIEAVGIQQETIEKAAEIVNRIETALEDKGVQAAVIEEAVEKQIDSMVAEIVAAENKEPVRDRMAELLTVLSAADIQVMIDMGIDPNLYDANTALAGFAEAMGKVEAAEKAANPEEVDATTAVEGSEANLELEGTTDPALAQEGATDSTLTQEESSTLGENVTGLKLEDMPDKQEAGAAEASAETIVDANDDREVVGQSEEKATGAGVGI